MGASKELFMEIRIKAEMDEQTYQDIPDHLKESMQIKAIERINLKDVYRKNDKWKEANKKLAESIQERQEIQDEIRANLISNK